MPFSCCCCWCCCCGISPLIFSIFRIISFSLFRHYISLYLRLVSCAYFLHISHFSILPICFLFLFKVHWHCLQRQQMSPQTASQSIFICICESCDCLSVSVSEVAAVCVSNVILAKESLETLCFASVNGKICIDLCWCFCPHFLGMRIVIRMRRTASAVSTNCHPLDAYQQGSPH